MNKELLLAGQKFKYNGHMLLMREAGALHFDNQVLQDNRGEAFATVDTDMSDKQFFIRKRGFGKIVVDFAECEPINNR